MPRSYDYPNRSCPVATARAASRVLPAATGEPAFEVQRCRRLSDGAHGVRSAGRTSSVAEASDLDGATHRCTCGLGWFSVEGTPAALITASYPTQRAPDSRKHETGMLPASANLVVKCGKVA